MPFGLASENKLRVSLVYGICVMHGVAVLKKANARCFILVQCHDRTWLCVVSAKPLFDDIKA